MSSIQPSPLLAFGLRLDGVGSFVAAALSLAMAPVLQAAVGTSLSAVQAVAMFTLVYGLLIGYTSTRTRLTTWLVWAVVIGNAGWVLGSVLLTYSNWIRPNGLGQAVLLGQATLVALFVVIQYLGLKRSLRQHRGSSGHANVAATSN
ncbi:MAG: hypothetical protein ACT4NL_18635 [Pseudomarimonas sp.]